VINIVFFGIFFSEMLTKIIGMGPVNYVKDTYNIFDAIIGKNIIHLNYIVSLSIIDVSLDYASGGGSENSGKGAISAFRAIRLLRVFKLAKSWKKLNFLLTTIVRSLKDISSFGVLVLIMIFIYTLLGMEFFALKNSEGPNNAYPGPSLGIINFDKFFSAIITVFTVLTGENWDSNMFYFSQKHGYLAIFYYL
jgi:Ion transport protein